MLDDNKYIKLIIKINKVIEEYKQEKDRIGLRLDSMEELIKFIVDEL